MTHTTTPDVTAVGDSKTEAYQTQAPRLPSSGALAASAPDQLTVLVFKDNFTARTFRIPLRWINQFGWILGVSFLTAILCVGIAIKLAASRRHVFNIGYVSQDLQGQAQAESKIHALETQLKEAQDRIQSLSVTAASAPQGANTAATTAANPAAAPATEPTDAPIIDPALISAASPISSKPFLFKALPDQTQTPAGDIPITLGAPSARWNGKTLAVRFNLQYISKTPGGQQGRIIILARGPGTVLAHPSSVFQEVGKDYLIDPNKGEYFSVSRYRETKADFGPISSHDSIKEVEVLVLSSTGQILIHHKIIPGKAVSAAAAPSAGAGPEVKGEE